MINTSPSTIESSVINDFGNEWEQFDQKGASRSELKEIFDRYFAIFPWDKVDSEAIGFDLGCGTGRWAQFVAPHVGHVHCIDPSPKALQVARENLAQRANCSFHESTVQAMPLAPDSMDFGYSLGVLHHTCDPQGGLTDCVTKLKRGAPFLVYLYYRFDNRPVWFRTLWRVTNVIRLILSRCPFMVKLAVSQILALGLYWPLARIAFAGERIGLRVDSWPLAFYRDRSLYVMRTDALDRFGTRVEHRFTRAEILEMLENAGLNEIRFCDHPPFWCAVGVKA